MQLKSPFVTARFALLSVVLGACSSSTSSGPGTGAPGGSVATKTSVKLQGSGASFPDPLYQRWIKAFNGANPNIRVEYTATGSGAGINDLTQKLVDFAGSDAAMSDEEIAKVEAGVVMLPVTAGKVVLAYNLPGGPAELKLSREAYVKIFLGEIKKWNDPIIVACNGGAAMPAIDVTPVVRADSSGTTFVFSQHLSAVNKDWEAKCGTGKTINWVPEKVVKAPKNAGVTEQLHKIEGAIGYIEYGFASQTGLPMASLENKAGKYIKPTLQSGVAALANVKEMPEDLRVWLPDPEGDDSYSIVTYTWLLCYTKYSDPAKAEALRTFVTYCSTEGQKVGGEMGYIALPQNVVDKVTQAVEKVQ